MKKLSFLLTTPIIVFLILLTCSPQISQKTLPLDTVLEHANSVLDQLQDQGFTVFKCRFHDDKIWVDVKINNREAEFFLDTGASFTLLSKKYVEDYNLKARISSNGSDSQIFSIQKRRILGDV
ncbi:MAG: retroviral-like aspartic protease family protein [Promethearchaeota archaeon]|jgi:hypothetical protein